MTEASFAGAGQTPGLELWRIEALKPKKLSAAEANAGKFHTGDSYILLSTSEDPKTRKVSWNIHFWLGAESSQDEQGVAAYKTVELDDSLGGRATQYRECQGHESSLFLSYFKNSGGIEYLPGGVDSGFAHVENDVYETRLLHLKGRRTVRVSTVPCARASLSRGDVYILDTGLIIYIFNGPEANKYEKLKGIETATRINNDQRGGRAAIIHVSEDDPTCADFWEPLGGYVDPASLPLVDDPPDAPLAASNKLFRVSDASGSVVFEEIPLSNGQLRKELLVGDDVMIVVTASKIYVWVGKGSNLNEKKESTAHAVRYAKENGLGDTCPIERVSQGAENAAFKAEFVAWDPPLSKAVVTSGIAATPPDSEIDVQAMLARTKLDERMVDDGTGTLQVWRIENFAKVPVPPEKHGQFYGGDSYILLYSYKDSRRADQHIIYFWLGKTSSADEKGTAALLSKELDDEMGGKPTQVRVVQGKEPAHFRQLFKGRMIVHKGGKASAFANRNDSDSMDEDGVALFHVKGSSALNTCGSQVEEKASSLNSSDCFVLVVPHTVYAWKGHGSTSDEQTVSLNIATILSGDYLGRGGREVVAIDEGSEPEAFWNALGGKGEYPEMEPGSEPPRDARLFHASTASGSFRVDEVYNFDQEDLIDDDVMILDTHTSLFVWMGSGATETERVKSMEFANSFLAADSSRSSDIPIIIVQSGEEPLLFTQHFLAWDFSLAESKKFNDPYKARLAALAAEKEANAAKVAAIKLKPTPAKPAPAPAPAPAPEPEPAPAPAAAAAPASDAPIDASQFLPYKQLAGVFPSGLDPTRKEEYLNDEEFVKYFSCTKAEFKTQPKWKRDAAKKKLNLF